MHLRGPEVVGVFPAVEGALEVDVGGALEGPVDGSAVVAVVHLGRGAGLVTDQKGEGAVELLTRL